MAHANVDAVRSAADCGKGAAAPVEGFVAALKQQAVLRVGGGALPVRDAKELAVKELCV